MGPPEISAMQIQDIAAGRQRRLGSDQEPTVLPIESFEASLDLAGGFGDQDFPPFVDRPGQIVGVNGRLPSLAAGLLKCQARVVPPSLVDEIDAAVGQNGPGHGGDGVDHHGGILCPKSSRDSLFGILRESCG